MERVIELRRLRRNGWQIAKQVGGSRVTVSRIVRCHGLNRLRSLDPPLPIRRYEHKRPDDLVHCDIKHSACIRKPVHRDMKFQQVVHPVQIREAKVTDKQHSS